MNSHLVHLSQLQNAIWILHIFYAGTDLANQVGVTHYYHFFYEGCLTNFEIGDDGAEATLLYPEVEYTRMDEYMKIYL